MTELTGSRDPGYLFGPDDGCPGPGPGPGTPRGGPYESYGSGGEL